MFYTNINQNVNLTCSLNLIEIEIAQRCKHYDNTGLVKANLQFLLNGRYLR